MQEKLLIGIGIEIGTRKLPDTIRQFRKHVQINSLNCDPSNYFRSVNGMHVALRISGEVKAFQPDVNDSRVRKMRNLPYLTTEWVITESEWNYKTADELNGLLMSGFAQCFDRLLAHAGEIGELHDRGLAVEDFNKILETWSTKFLTMS